MFGLPIGFLNPWILLALLSLPVIWWLLRLTPPRPQEETFPPTRILARLNEQEETPAQSPWWLTLLRLAMASLIILAMAGPVLNPEESSIGGEGTIMLVIDDGWTTGADWELRQETALAIITEAERDGRTIMLQTTTDSNGWSDQPMSATDARALVQGATASPLPPFLETTARKITAAGNQNEIGQLHFISDGLEHEGTETLVSAINEVSNDNLLYLSQTSRIAAIGTIRNNPSMMTGLVNRVAGDESSQFEVEAFDRDGAVISRTRIEIPAGETQAEFSFDQPVELRNQISRLAIKDANTAGAIKLLDANNRRRLVGLVSGEAFDLAQPLLSPLYYISRALEPYSDIRRSDSANVAEAIPDLINQGVSVIIMADVGAMPDETAIRLSDWIEKGGMLVRFAGPRLGASPQNELLPVEIRPGDRRLGGALSWETPKALAPFERESPFFGLLAPQDVLVSKQLLALQATGLDEKTWSRLEDGTPLVTAEQRGFGRIVFFHVSTDAEWSNLPLSGTFVEMLRRTVTLSSSFATGGGAEEEVVLPPLRILDASGKFAPANEETQSLIVTKEGLPPVSQENPPGFYGTEDGVRALNLFDEAPALVALDESALVGAFDTRPLKTGETQDLTSWLLLAAGILLLLDCLAVLWMSGAGKNALKRAGLQNAAVFIAVGLMTGAMLFATASNSFAQSSNEEFDYSSALETRLAYVITGVDEVDRISDAGMRGLTHFLSTRTALEPGEPVGLDVSQDELSFYSLIYWPIDPRADIPDDQTMARIDAFMKNGGSVLFDTRDQIAGFLGGTSDSPAARMLQTMLSSLDIPPLEPVPSDHVLTKSFYLLDDFPGRYNGGKLWVEASQASAADEGRPVRIGDGVSTILITSNDFAGAWAVDSSLRPILPTVPPDPSQRTYAFRSGVNLMMYALTGNYKSDQVHIKDLLERLGQ